MQAFPVIPEKYFITSKFKADHMAEFLAFLLSSSQGEHTCVSTNSYVITHGK